MADPTRLELATSAVTGQRSNQLSYESTISSIYYHPYLRKSFLSFPQSMLKYYYCEYRITAIMFPSQGRDEGPTPSTRTIYFFRKSLGDFFIKISTIIITPKIFYSSFKLIFSRTSPSSRIFFIRLLNSRNGTLIEL